MLNLESCPTSNSTNLLESLEPVTSLHAEEIVIQAIQAKVNPVPSGRGMVVEPK